MEKIYKIDEFYSERINEVQLKLDHVHENLDNEEISNGLLEFLKSMDEHVEGIYEDAIDYLIETKIDTNNSVTNIEELSSDDENPEFIKKFEEK